MRSLCPELVALGQSLAGVFENCPQAAAEPIWYVPLRLWLRPVPLFSEDSLTLFAEQSNVLYVDAPYRQRLLRLRQLDGDLPRLQIQFYQFKAIEPVKGAGTSRDRLQQITEDSVRLLENPGCTLAVEVEATGDSGYRFRAFPVPDCPCQFSYQDRTFQVALGLEVDRGELRTFDRGIDPQTGKPIWGALMGPYRFNKVEDFSKELDLP